MYIKIFGATHGSSLIWSVVRFWFVVVPPAVAAHPDTMAAEFEKQRIAESSDAEDLQEVADVKKEAKAKGEEEPEQTSSGSKEPSKSANQKNKFDHSLEMEL